MSKELLKALVDVLDDLKLRKNLSEDDALNISHSVLMRAEKAVENYLAQPEQTKQELQEAFRAGVRYSAQKYRYAMVTRERFTGNDVAMFLEMEACELSDADITKHLEVDSDE